MRFIISCALTTALFSNSIAAASVRCVTATDTSSASVVLSEAQVLGVGFGALPLLTAPKSTTVLAPSEWSGTTSISEALEFVSGVDVRTRGAWGVQTDISIRAYNLQ